MVSPKYTLLKTLNITNNDPKHLNDGFGVIFYFLGTIYIILNKWYKYYWGWYCHSAYSCNNALTHSQHTFAYHDKDVEVIQQSNTIPPKIHVADNDYCNLQCPWKLIGMICNDLLLDGHHIHDHFFNDTNTIADDLVTQLTSVNIH